jgi:glycosyltransferase involved in cell wall biosynthesis
VARGPAGVDPMRVLLLVDVYLPHPKSQAKLIHDLGAALVAEGHAVAIAAPSENARADVEVTDEDGMRVARVRGPRIKGANKVMRAIHEERLSSLMWRRGRRFFEGERFDLVVYYSPTIFFARLVRRLKRLWGCPSYLILRDIFPQWAVDAGVLRKGVVWRFFRRRELQQYAAADVIAVQSPRNLDYFRTALARRRYRLEVLYNWTLLEDGDAPPGAGAPSRERGALRARLGLRDEVVFFYGGNIGVAQDMDNIMRLARAFPRDPRALFLLVGDGSEVERLSATIRDERIDNVRILPAVGQREYLAMLREVDVGLISLDRRLKTQNFPGKLLGYMQTGLPVLASLNPGNDLGPLLVDAEAGLCAENGEDGKLLGHAVALARDAALRARMGLNGRRLLEARFSARGAARQVVSRWAPAAREAAQ